MVTLAILPIVQKLNRDKIRSNKHCNDILKMLNFGNNKRNFEIIQVLTLILWKFIRYLIVIRKQYIFCQKYLRQFSVYFFLVLENELEELLDDIMNV